MTKLTWDVVKELNKAYKEWIRNLTSNIGITTIVLTVPNRFYIKKKRDIEKKEHTQYSKEETNTYFWIPYF